MGPAVPQHPIPMDWQAVSAASYVHELLSTGTVDSVSVYNSLKIKECAKYVCKMHEKLRKVKH